MADPIWYLGAPGDMRELFAPEMDIDITEERYGGVFQGLSGARSVDVTGFRQRLTFDMKWVDPAEYVWYEALYRRLIPGTLRLINPLKKNRLSQESSMGQWGGYTTNGLSLTSGSMTRLWDWPSTAPPIALSTNRWGARVSGAVFRTDETKRIPVIAGETITASVWLKSTVAHSVTLAIDWADRLGAGTAASTTSVVSVTTAWQRFALTAAVPAGTHLVTFAGYSFTTNNLDVGPLQLESGASATSWEMGGGAPSVVIDQMPVTTPRYPLRNVTMVLLEV